MQDVPNRIVSLLAGHARVLSHAYLPPLNTHVLS